MDMTRNGGFGLVLAKTIKFHFMLTSQSNFGITSIKFPGVLLIIKALEKLTRLVMFLVRQEQSQMSCHRDVVA